MEEKRYTAANKGDPGWYIVQEGGPEKGPYATKARAERSFLCASGRLMEEAKEFGWRIEERC